MDSISYQEASYWYYYQIFLWPSKSFWHKQISETIPISSLETFLCGKARMFLQIPPFSQVYEIWDLVRLVDKCHQETQSKQFYCNIVKFLVQCTYLIQRHVLDIRIFQTYAYICCPFQFTYGSISDINSLNQIEFDTHSQQVGTISQKNFLVFFKKCTDIFILAK